MFIYYFIFNKVRGNTSCAVIGTPTLHEMCIVDLFAQMCQFVCAKAIL